MTGVLEPSNRAAPVPPYRPGAAVPAPLVLYVIDVPDAWIDYHAHMSEAYYLAAFSNALDPLAEYLGFGAAYRKAGFSYFSVGCRLDFLAQVGSGERLAVATRVFAADRKRIHLVSDLLRGAEPVARAEQMMLHVDLATGRATEAPQVPILDTIAAVREAHDALPRSGREGQGLSLPGR